LVAVIGRTFGAVIESMASSYLIALVIITLLMVWLIGSLRVGLVSMIPNLLPVVATLGLMGALSIPLDPFTLLIGCIVIGVAVDDTIHFFHGFVRYREESGDSVFAIRETLRTTGRALLVSSLTLAAGFWAFTLSSLTSIVSFGSLAAFAIVVAFVADVVVAPALLILVYGAGDRADGG